MINKGAYRLKRLRKILIIICLIFLAICQMNNKVYCYTIDEVKDKINFRLVEESGEPDNYDVLIDARDLIDNEQLPCIETSIETVLYGDDDLLSIDFLRDNSQNSSEEWKKVISNPVQAFFRVLLYMSLAMMLTLLLYMAVMMVRAGISNKESILPLSNVFGIGNSKDNPKKHMKEKGFVEQWIFATAMLIFMVYAINLIVGFSNILTNISNNFKPDEEEDDSIVVYVKNSKESVDISSITGTTTSRGSVLSNDIRSYINTEAASGNWAVYAKNLSSNTDVVTYNNTNQMPSASVIKLFIAAAAYEKADEDSSYKVNTDDMEKMITVSDNNAANNLIDAVGKDYINSYISNNGYTSTELNREFGITSFVKDNYTSANDVGKLLENIYSDKCAGASKILDYMKEQEIRKKIPAGISEDITIANKTGELGSDYPNGPVENDAAIVYKDNANYLLVILSSNLGEDTKAISDVKEISSRVYNGIDSDTGADSSENANTTTTRTFDYYFKTNLEGLLMFQSQYNWEDYTLENIFNMVTGFSVTAFKIILYVLFFVRMIILAVLTALAPLIVVINAFMKINGNKGCLTDCLKLYLYCVFFRPVIAIIYYVLVKSNVYVVSQYPYYIVFVMVAIITLIVVSLNMLLKSIKIKKKQSKAKKKAK